MRSAHASGDGAGSCRLSPDPDWPSMPEPGNQKKLGWTEAVGDSRRCQLLQADSRNVRTSRASRRITLFKPAFRPPFFLQMPLVAFSELPSNARLWVFACDREIAGDQASSLLAQ